MTKRKTFLYKPCCGMRCLVGGCKTREAGGCYCVCRLKDMESHCEDLISGECYQVGGGIIYEPGRKVIPLKGEAKENVLKKLENIREKLKEYKITETDS